MTVLQFDQILDYLVFAFLKQNLLCPSLSCSYITNLSSVFFVEHYSFSRISCNWFAYQTGSIFLAVQRQFLREFIQRVLQKQITAESQFCKKLHSWCLIGYKQQVQIPCLEKNIRDLSQSKTEVKINVMGEDWN